MMAHYRGPTPEDRSGFLFERKKAHRDAWVDGMCSYVGQYPLPQWRLHVTN